MSDREGLEKLAELADRMDRAMETIHARELRDIRRALLAAGTEDGDTNVNPDAQPISLAEQNAGTDGPGLLEAAQEVLDSAGSSDLGKIQVTQHSLEQLHAALAARPVEAKAEAGLMEKIRDMLQNDYNFDFGIAEEVAERVLALTRPVAAAPGEEARPSYELYTELLYEVVNHLEGETRHEVARRIIHEHENRQSGQAAALHPEGTPKEA